MKELYGIKFCFIGISSLLKRLLKNTFANCPASGWKETTVDQGSESGGVWGRSSGTFLNLPSQPHASAEMFNSEIAKNAEM